MRIVIRLLIGFIILLMEGRLKTKRRKQRRIRRVNIRAVEKINRMEVQNYRSNGLINTKINKLIRPINKRNLTITLTKIQSNKTQCKYSNKSNSKNSNNNNSPIYNSYNNNKSKTITSKLKLPNC